MSTVEGVLTFLALPLLLGVSAIFSALQTALFALRPVDLSELEHRDAPLAKLLGRLLADPHRLLNAILLGDTLANLPLILVCLYLLRAAGTVVLAPLWAKGVAILALVALVVVLCDLLPKLFGLARPLVVARFTALPLSLVLPVLAPTARLIERVSDKLASLLLPARMHPRTLFSEEELETLVEIGEEEGTLGQEESEIIHEILKLGDKTAKDCMTPRIEMDALADDLPNLEAIAALRKARHRRVPVYADTPDNIVGILDVREFLRDPSEHFTEGVLPPSFVSETMRALDLFRSFLSHRQGMAIVVDEFGGTEGIVTLSDILEFILGDAVPLGNRTLYIEELGAGKLVVSGHARLDDLDELLDLTLTAEDKLGIDTIGGLVFHRLGQLPRNGETLPLGPYQITIRRVSRRRIEELLIEPAAAPGRKGAA